LISLREGLSALQCKLVTAMALPIYFIERVIGTTRREYLDYLIFFNDRDLQKKLDHFQDYYSDHRCHSSLGMKTPKMMAMGNVTHKNIASLDEYRWKSHCNGLYQLPVAA
jgi:hypothetical protein